MHGLFPVGSRTARAWAVSCSRRSVTTSLGVLLVEQAGLGVGGVVEVLVRHLKTWFWITFQRVLVLQSGALRSEQGCGWCLKPAGISKCQSDPKRAIGRGGCSGHWGNRRYRWCGWCLRFHVRVTSQIASKKCQCRWRWLSQSPANIDFPSL